MVSGLGGGQGQRYEISNQTSISYLHTNFKRIASKERTIISVNVIIWVGGRCLLTLEKLEDLQVMIGRSK